jgi:hypothetical protein
MMQCVLNVNWMLRWKHNNLRHCDHGQEKATARELGLLTKLANVAAIMLTYTRLLGHTEGVRASHANSRDRLPDRPIAPAV